jgi:predicted DsbA family dithiol-disulfide isomerase
MEKLHIAMVHDIVCSWCPIGYNNVKKAISNLNLEVEFHFLPFELNPDMTDNGESIASYFGHRFGWDKPRLLAYQHSLVKTAADAKVSIDFSKRTHYYNTYNAHLLMHYAERFNKQTILNEHLIKVYFNEGLDINKLPVLLDIAQEIGLDREQTNIALTSTSSDQESKQKLKHGLAKKFQRYQALNVSSIPAFIINNTELISGSNSVHYFEQVLSKLNKIKETVVA